MKKKEKLRNNKIEKPHNKEIKEKPESNNKFSDERLNQQAASDLKKSETDSIKTSNISHKKTKKKSNKKRKSIEMYIVLTVFLFIPIICSVVCNYVFNSETAKIFDKNKTASLAIFILMLIGAFLLSTIISCCECLIKTHFLGIIFFIILNTAMNYCILYISYLSYFEQIFCFLIVLVSGSFGCLFITILVKDESPSIFILLIFNLIFSITAGVIIIFFYNSTWDIVLSVLAFVISEFNVYSSQYKVCSKDDKKDPMTYSQPFELIITICKMSFFLTHIIVKFIKFMAKICKCKKKQKPNKDDINDQNKENIPNDDNEEGIDNNEVNTDVNNENN